MGLVGRAVAALAVATSSGGAAAHAQTDVEALGRALGGAVPPPAYYAELSRNPRAFRFSDDNAWIRKGRAVAGVRDAARAAVAGGDLLPVAQASFVGGVMQGDLNVPAFLALYANTSGAIVDTLPHATMADRLYGTDPAPPYSIHTFYRELSDDRLRVNGTVFDWTRVSGDDSVYEGGCNGLCSNGDIPGLIRELVAAHDDTVDYGRFDNDGPDGIPNSGDDDGVVDAVVIMHPEVDGACGNVTPSAAANVWAHRWSYAARAGTTLATADPSNAPGVTFIQVNDYIIQGGQGGDGGCAAGEPAAMGIIAHETGHLLGLPDLYDVNGITAGIGFWGLMGSGNWNKANSPAHMEAWSRAQLGWVTEVFLPRDTTIELGPTTTSDTAFVVPIADSDEYFLLENRQRLGADVNLKAPGLLVWHVDSARIASRWLSNTVNAFLPHGLALQQADGRSDMLGSSSSRGDSGDPFPGATGNTAFAGGTNPSSARNDGTPSFVAVDSIRQIPALRMSARIRRNPIRIFATDTNAVFRLDGQPYRVFTDLLEPSSLHQLEMDSVQLANGDRSRFEWLAWSNGLPRSHTYTAAGGDTVIADVAAEHLLRVQVLGPGGGVSASPVVDYVGGEFLAAGTPVQLSAAVSEPDHIFEGWTGDTVTSAATVVLTMQRPYDITAVFAAPLAVTDGTPAEAVMGAQYSFTFSASGGVDAKTWSLATGTLPANLRLWSDGVLSGRPEETGTFALTVRVVSGSQTAQFAVQLEVVAPALVAGDVVAHVTGAGQTLTADEITYLDLVGNRNSRLDVGDFLAWVETTGGAVSAGEMSRVLKAAGKEQP